MLYLNYTLEKIVKIRLKIDRQLVMRRTSSRIKSSRKYREDSGLVTKCGFFSELLELYRIFQKWRSLWEFMEEIFINFNINFLLICCTEDYTCTAEQLSHR